MEPAHISVLKEEVVKIFAGSVIHTFVDGTLGAGGHAEAILSTHPEIETYLGIDQDPLALKMARERLKPWGDKTVFISGNFVDMTSYVKKPVNGILLDIGVSSMQFDMPEKGFSFMQEGPLDMRMDLKIP